MDVTGMINKHPDLLREAKWTYNTGVMISNGVRLYKITGEQTYLDSAIASSEGAYNYFVRPLNGLASGLSRS